MTMETRQSAMPICQLVMCLLVCLINAADQQHGHDMLLAFAFLYTKGQSWKEIQANSHSKVAIFISCMVMRCSKADTCRPATRSLQICIPSMVALGGLRGLPPAAVVHNLLNGPARGKNGPLDLGKLGCSAATSALTTS